MRTYKDYVEKTWLDFLKFKFTNFPTLAEARLWKIGRMGGGAMSPEEFQQYVESVGEDNAIRINKLRQRSLLQWYLREWKNWFTLWSRHQYNEAEFDSFCNELAEEREWMRNHPCDFDAEGNYIAPPKPISEQEYWNMREE